MSAELIAGYLIGSLLSRANKPPSRLPSTPKPLSAEEAAEGRSCPAHFNCNCYEASR